jgi:hypothetical protein
MSPRARSEAHVRLGQALRAARVAAGISTRLVPKDPSGQTHYSSGHISLVESGATPPSPELIDSYLAMASQDGGTADEVRMLYEQMQVATRDAGRRRRGAPAPATRPPRGMDEVGSRHDVQQHYLVSTTEAHYRFGPTGAIRAVLCTVLLQAKSPGVRMYYTGFSYPADPRRGVLQFRARSGATLVESQESSSGAVGTYFRLDRELSPDDPAPHTLVFEVEVDSPARATPRLGYFAASGTDRMVLRAGFDAAAEPASLWWFAVADIIDIEYPRPDQAVDRDPDGAFGRRFERLVPGWCYGFAWDWRQAE